MTRKLTIPTLAAVALAIAGCQDPYTQHARPSKQPATASPRAKPNAGGAETAARSFALRWVNWDWRTAASQQRALALLATGPLAQQLRANATSARIDASLARDKPGSRGTIAATNISTRAARATGLVVTREQTYTAGHPDLGGKRYRVYLVRLQHQHAGWEVNAWAPQP